MGLARQEEFLGKGEGCKKDRCSDFLETRFFGKSPLVSAYREKYYKPERVEERCFSKQKRGGG